MNMKTTIHYCKVLCSLHVYAQNPLRMYLFWERAGLLLALDLSYPTAPTFLLLSPLLLLFAALKRFRSADLPG